MNLSGALSNAATGLAATARLADTISNNVANAMTPGFGKRTTEVSSLSLGGYGSGVRVTGTTRAENPFLTAERRGLDAALGASGARADTYDRLIASLGEPGSASALASRATALETRLMGAVTSPGSVVKLADTVTGAKQLAGAVNAVAAENVRIRTEADAEIALQVAQVNEGLHAVSDLNRKIATLTNRGEDVLALQDERNRTIDAMSSIIPLRAVKRNGGQVALYAQNGGALLDGRVWELDFQRAPAVVTPAMTLGAGLSGLSQEQGAPGGPVALDAGTGRGLMDGGSLGALFEVRDRIVPEVDAEIDLYAQDLIARFRDTMPAGALDAGGNGLFVDRNPGGLNGLAGRLQVNAAVDPGQGGEVWRLRDGLSAAAPGNTGFGTYLEGLSAAMTAPRDPAGFVSQTAAAGSADMAAEISSFFAGKAARGDEDRAFLTARQAVMSERESAVTGVDTDSELQSLMVIEQAYAANARVLSTIDGLMQLLLEI